MAAATAAAEKSGLIREAQFNLPAGPYCRATDTD